ncbi:nucleotide disphospho-sugar-binding domain-containing protein [Streptomyces sparsogenes]|uniref:nucleotide disphospho-sugar-binding domain-containing protein n=1 Tax=Streptomyces sparsogenes TaxID=67365 RepID=UPI0033F56915
MRVLFTTWSSGGHLTPMVPLARAFEEAGHQVRVAVPSGCAAAVARTGLVPVPVGTLPKAARAAGAAPRLRGRWPADWPLRPAELGAEQRGLLRALGDKQVRIAEAMAQGLVAFARCWRPALVVHDASAYAGTVAAAVLGVPAVGQMWGSAAVLRLDRQDLHGPPLPGYARLMRRYGADPAREPDLWLDPCPPSLALPAPVRRTPVRFAAPDDGTGPADPGAPAAPAGRDGEPPGAVSRICLAWDDADGPPEAVRAALRQVGARGVQVVARPGAAWPPLRPPEGCRAVVHQGGGAAVVAAAAAGVPQLVVAPRPEQQLNGARLALAGAGRLLTADTSAAHVLAALSELLERPSYTAAARGLRAEILALPGPEETVARLTNPDHPGRADPPPATPPPPATARHPAAPPHPTTPPAPSPYRGAAPC